MKPLVVDVGIVVGVAEVDVPGREGVAYPRVRPVPSPVGLERLHVVVFAFVRLFLVFWSPMEARRRSGRRIGSGRTEIRLSLV